MEMRLCVHRGYHDCSLSSKNTREVSFWSKYLSMVKRNSLDNGDEIVDSTG